VEQDGVEAERRLLEMHHAGLDLRQVEDVVDDAEQALGGVVDLAQVIALAVVQFGLQGEVGHADDGVHRGADLVAHVGQEVRLGGGSRFGGGTGALGFPFRFLER
jgi:hypothetical protein